MSSLYFIGLGLSKKFLTKASIDAIKLADLVFFDSYTSISCDIDIEYLKKISGKDIILANRNLLENDSNKILHFLDEGKSVAILSIGDSMIATTHVSLAVEAKNRGHKIVIVPGISVQCYIISKSMLSSYKFGRAVTLVYPYEGRLDMSTYEVIKNNINSNLHTILYLDIRDGKPMSAREAIMYLLKMEEEKRENIITDNTWIIVGQRLGCDDEEVKSMTVKEALEYNFKDPPHIIIIPSKNLHYMEVEAIKCLH
ncbi:diphthine synthase [Acidianus sulfidivorans JP7]|uniref:Diphthine synthase n=1 Tax=Acidianus sulfidivorans JP7 TaxID=619593 RepID=A0A2U9IQL3_9CREN|nr:diphthine synthase [Acidianus sulfidivorans]AWR98321.1 diphthine synthase [Acidianus sulfidivorans JP7]